MVTMELAASPMQHWLLSLTSGDVRDPAQWRDGLVYAKALASIHPAWFCRLR